MITKVIMPQMSLTMQSGIVSSWLKKEGDNVEKGEPLCTIEGDKASVDVEAPASGILKEIVAREGEEFPVKKTMAYIGNPDDVIEKESGLNSGQTAKPEMESTKRVSSPQSPTTEKRIKASPVAKRLAQEKGIDLSLIKGSGPDGLIGKEDVLAFKGSSQSEETVKELNGIEKIIAERMELSNKEIPHFHLSTTCHIQNANLQRKEINQSRKDGAHITLTDLVIWAVSRSLAKHNLINSTFNKGQVLIHDKIMPGLAVNTPKGLVVIVIKEADKKTLLEISEERNRLVQKAMEGKQTSDDLADCTFTISNLGMFGIESFDPIITPGQVGILGVGALSKVFTLDKDGKVVPSEKISISLGCDHRVVDGVSGAEFLNEIKTYLENPTEIFR